jgi:hypothetical protein
VKFHDKARQEILEVNDEGWFGGIMTNNEELHQEV